MSAAAPKRELEVVPVACRWYGKNSMFGRLVPTGGNQCGLIKTAHSPCKMEQNGNPIDETRCPLVHQAVSQTAEREREAFDAGVRMGRNGEDEVPRRFEDGPTIASFLQGHRVGSLEREREARSGPTN